MVTKGISCHVQVQCIQIINRFNYYLATYAQSTNSSGLDAVMNKRNMSRKNKTHTKRTSHIRSEVERKVIEGLHIIKFLYIYNDQT